MSTGYGLQTPIYSGAIIGRMRKYGYSARAADDRDFWLLGHGEDWLLVFGSGDPREPNMVSEVQRSGLNHVLPIIQLLAWEFQVVIVDENGEFVRWPSPNHILERLALGATNVQQLRAALLDVAKRPMLGSCLSKDPDDKEPLVPHRMILARMVYDARAVFRTKQWSEWKGMCWDPPLGLSSEVVHPRPVAVDDSGSLCLWKEQDMSADCSIFVLPGLDGLTVK